MPLSRDLIIEAGERVRVRFDPVTDDQTVTAEPYREQVEVTTTGDLPGHGTSTDPTSAKGSTVQIDKSQILDLLHSQGRHDEAQQAEGELPDQVDTDQHGGLLSKFGIDPGNLPGGLGGMLGKIL